MSNQQKTDNKRQSRQQQQQNQSDRNRQPGRQAQQVQGKPSWGDDSKSDLERQKQEKEGKGKIASSVPGGDKSDRKHL
jgi:hypothetical protein